MKYCLSVGIHNLFYDIAIVNDKYEIIDKRKCSYDRNKDIASNIFNAYQKYFSGFKLIGVGVGISNNIDHKDDFLYKVTSFGFNRYNLKQSLGKLFKIDVYMLEDTYLASLALSYKLDVESLMYIILDNRISNSIVIRNQILELEDDIDLKKNKNLYIKCGKNALKSKFLIEGFDDDNICLHFLSHKKETKNLIGKWVKDLEINIKKVIKEIPVKNIVFGGFIGSYYDYFKEYLLIGKNIKCSGVSNHRDLTLLGIGNLIFKDKQ